MKSTLNIRRAGRWLCLTSLALALSAQAGSPAADETSGLTPDVLYQVLLAEIAAQRDQIDLSIRTYLNLADSTRDPQVAKRAAEIALYAHQPAAALRAISLWLEEDPSSQEGREALAALLLSEGKLQDSKDVLKKLLTADRTHLAEDFRSLSVIFSQYPDHAGALALAKDLAAPYPQLAEAHYLVSSSAYLASQQDLALREAREASRLKPGWEVSTLLEARILQRKDPAEARRFYQDFLDRYPQARDTRLMFARFLVESKDFTTAREQFSSLLKDSPGNPDLTLAVALLTLQLKDYAGAESLFLKSISQGYRDPDAIRFYLGESNEEQKQWVRAEQWYRQVTGGEQAFVARIKVAQMLARQNELAKATEVLHAIPVESKAQRQQLIMAEEQILRESHDYEGAYQTLTSALKADPDAADLLYERAIVADKLNRMDSVERDLRKVIALRPDYAHAYNALGYSLADRDQRLDEALQLIQKALAISPDDPFIIDSLGWVQFRMGHLQDSIDTLKRAYALQEDPEIAAHLGEVQWASGDHVGARQTWENSLKSNPDNEALQATIHRFLP